MEKKLMLPGGLLWVTGFAAWIIGVNVQGDTGRWIQIGGNIAFVLGLLLVGAAWFKKKRAEEENARNQKDAPEKTDEGGEKRA